MISLLDFYAKGVKAETQTDICTPVFIVALFTVVKSWKWPKCPLANRWLNKSFYIYMQLYIIQL